MSMRFVITGARRGNGRLVADTVLYALLLPSDAVITDVVLRPRPRR
ncbi:hypothetical protein [Microlunatus elymi]|nr:hypothetical protein [Microlunatus elymi]